MIRRNTELFLEGVAVQEEKRYGQIANAYQTIQDNQSNGSRFTPKNPLASAVYGVDRERAIEEGMAERTDAFSVPQLVNNYRIMIGAQRWKNLLGAFVDDLRQSVAEGIATPDEETSLAACQEEHLSWVTNPLDGDMLKRGNELWETWLLFRLEGLVTLETDPFRFAENQAIADAWEGQLPPGQTGENL